jgi:hypothetical protein
MEKGKKKIKIERKTKKYERKNKEKNYLLLTTSSEVGCDVCCPIAQTLSGTRAACGFCNLNFAVRV